jgi:hypothetical protein
MMPVPNVLAKPDGQFNVVQHTQQNLQQAQVQHKALLESQKRMNAAKSTLDSLVKLGDQVQVEDVIKGAGTMVGAGFSPQALAQMLAQMPTTGGQALEAWVAQQDQRAQQLDGQLRQKLEASAVHRGISAMASLHVDHIKGQNQALANPGLASLGSNGNALTAADANLQQEET